MPNVHAPLRSATSAIVLAAVLVRHPAAAQLPAGQLTQRVPAVSDSSQAYALYLPPGYTTARRWPTLFVLDPRGRALIGVQLFQDAAARLGWVVLSSYNSLSDGPPEATADALNAMLASAYARVGVDTSRLYLAGFSGTAREVLRFAVMLRGHVRGVIAASGALGFELGGPETIFAGDPTFGYFGTAGTGDFNYQEVRAMSERFSKTRVPHRVVWFDGTHSWPPKPQCEAALEWLELRAMVSGLRSADTAWIRTRLSQELARAVALEDSGKWDEALQLNEAIARDYAGWPGVAAAADRTEALHAKPAMRAYEEKQHRLAEREYGEGMDQLRQGLAWARRRADPPELADLLHRLQVRELRDLAERGDSLDAASARRRLARIFVWLAFYEPRTYLAQGDPRRALRMFEAAVMIGPITGEACGLLETALSAASPDQRERLAGQCAAGTH